MASVSAFCLQGTTYLLSPVWVMKLFYETWYRGWLPCPVPCMILTTLKFIFNICQFS